MRDLRFRIWKDNKFTYSYEFNEFYEFFERACHDEDLAEQYTGLLDSEGREIYEGDVVRYEPNKLVDRIGQIKWSDYYNGWSVRDKDCYPASDFGEYSLASPFLSFNYVKIIGNIHENPELLR